MRESALPERVSGPRGLSVGQNCASASVICAVCETEMPLDRFSTAGQARMQCTMRDVRWQIYYRLLVQVQAERYVQRAFFS